MAAGSSTGDFEEGELQEEVVLPAAATQPATEPAAETSEGERQRSRSQNEPLPPPPPPRRPQHEGRGPYSRPPPPHFGRGPPPRMMPRPRSPPRGPSYRHQPMIDERARLQAKEEREKEELHSMLDELTRYVSLPDAMRSLDTVCMDLKKAIKKLDKLLIIMKKKRGDDISELPSCFQHAKKIVEGLRSVNVVVGTSIGHTHDMAAVLNLFKAAMNYRHDVFSGSQKQELEGWVHSNKVLQVIVSEKDQKGRAGSQGRAGSAEPTSQPAQHKSQEHAQPGSPTAGLQAGEVLPPPPGPPAHENGMQVDDQPPGPPAYLPPPPGMHDAEPPLPAHLPIHTSLQQQQQADSGSAASTPPPPPPPPPDPPPSIDEATSPPGPPATKSESPTDPAMQPSDIQSSGRGVTASKTRAGAAASSMFKFKIVVDSKPDDIVKAGVSGAGDGPASGDASRDVEMERETDKKRALTPESHAGSEPGSKKARSDVMQEQVAGSTFGGEVESTRDGRPASRQGGVSQLSQLQRTVTYRDTEQGLAGQPASNGVHQLPDDGRGGVAAASVQAGAGGGGDGGDEMEVELPVLHPPVRQGSDMQLDDDGHADTRQQPEVISGVGGLAAQQQQQQSQQQPSFGGVGRVDSAGPGVQDTPLQQPGEGSETVRGRDRGRDRSERVRDRDLRRDKSEERDRDRWSARHRGGSRSPHTRSHSRDRGPDRYIEGRGYGPPLPLHPDSPASADVGHMMSKLGRGWMVDDRDRHRADREWVERDGGMRDRDGPGIDEILDSYFRRGKLVLVIDLDHTLLSSIRLTELDAHTEAQLADRLAIEAHTVADHDRELYRSERLGIWSKLRPGAREFLYRAADKFELWGYSACPRPYAEAMTSLLDPDGRFFEKRIIAVGGDVDGPDGQGAAMDARMLAALEARSAVVLVLDTPTATWPAVHRLNLIGIERYLFFPCATRKFGLEGRSLLQINRDECPERGMLMSMWGMVERMHTLVFAYLNNPGSSWHLLSGRPTDPHCPPWHLRNVLPDERRKVLQGVCLVFSRVFATDADARAHPLWRMAESYGAVCEVACSERTTHVIAAARGTEKTLWAAQNGKAVVTPAWLECSCTLWRKANEERFLLPLI